MSKFLKFIVNLVVICAILVAAALLVPPLAGVKTVMIDGSGSETNLPQGSVTYGQSAQVSQLGEGDKVLVENGTSVYEYVIEEIDATAGTYTMSDPYDKGAEEQSVKLSGQVAKSIVTVPYIAYAAIALQSMEGLIIAGLAIVFLVILFILSELWKKDDDEDEEEDEEENDGEETEPVLPVPDTSHEMPGAAEAVMQESLASVAQGVTEAASEKEGTSPSDVGNAEMPEEEPAADEETDAGAVDETEEAAEEAVQESEPELVPARDAAEDIAAREQILPSMSAAELIAKATVDGEDPEIVEDEEQGITLLDYSKIL